jgi:hypothetical protein
LNIKLNLRICVQFSLPHAGHFIWWSAIVFSNTSNEDASLTLASGANSSISLSALNLCLHSLQSINGSEKLAKCPEAL